MEERVENTETKLRTLCHAVSNVQDNVKALLSRVERLESKVVKKGRSASESNSIPPLFQGNETRSARAGLPRHDDVAGENLTPDSTH